MHSGKQEVIHFFRIIDHVKHADKLNDITVDSDMAFQEPGSADLLVAFDRRLPVCEKDYSSIMIYYLLGGDSLMHVSGIKGKKSNGNINLGGQAFTLYAPGDPVSMAEK